MNERKLMEEAFAARKSAYAPYSQFTVGAALLTESGKVYRGCNVENSAYPAGNCAERTAFFKAVSEGERKFEAIAVAGGPAGEDSVFCPPCGICRQVMAEFCSPDFSVILTGKAGRTRRYTLEELLPWSFSLKGGEEL